MARHDTLQAGELTDTAYYILLSLVEAKHGYSVMKTIEGMTNSQVSIGPASLYTTLKKLLAADLIELAEQDTSTKKKTYVTTSRGLALLQSEVERRREMVACADRILQKRGE